MFFNIHTSYGVWVPFYHQMSPSSTTTKLGGWGGGRKKKEGNSFPSFLDFGFIHKGSWPCGDRTSARQVRVKAAIFRPEFPTV